MLAPALHFPGTCSAAIELYQKALKAEVGAVSYCRDAPEESGYRTPETLDNIMHAELTIAGSRITMCDVTEEVVPGNLYVLGLFLDTADEVKSAYALLSDGATVLTELGPQFWTPMYVDLLDRFGVHWQLMSVN